MSGKKAMDTISVSCLISTYFAFFSSRFKPTMHPDTLNCWQWVPTPIQASGAACLPSPKARGKAASCPLLGGERSGALFPYTLFLCTFQALILQTFEI